MAKKKNNPPTRLESFLLAKGISPSKLQQTAVRPGTRKQYSLKHLVNVRKGRAQPTLQCISAIVTACRKLSRMNVTAEDLFDLGEERKAS